MDSFKLQIMASDHMVYDGLAESVSLQTIEGSVGILAHHCNIIMAAAPGILEYVAAEGESDISAPSPGAGRDDRSAGQKGRRRVLIADGIVKVENGEVMILVNTAEDPDEIDENRARRAEEKARAELRKTNSDREHALVSAELSRAMSRIKASTNKHHL